MKPFWFLVLGRVVWLKFIGFALRGQNSNDHPPDEDYVSRAIFVATI
jgi:hypothetical protein